MLSDTFSAEELEGLRLPEIDRALEQIHRPRSLEEIEPARRRLAYGELRRLYFEQRPSIRKKRELIHERSSSYDSSEPSLLQQELIDSLGFPLSGDQLGCISEINRDLSSGAGMQRLLQGDVGSGKTLVALLAALKVVEDGGQVAFMVPTELLAYQHEENIRTMLERIGSGNSAPNLHIFIAAMGKAEKEAALGAMADSPGIWLGTHSLFSEGVNFSNLQLVIIDEQHRFGVNQREQLRSKALVDRILMLSATPIPRTLTLTLFGNMDISTIRTMPAGRLPVITHLAAMGREEKVYVEVEKQLALGRQGYFVYPRIEGNEDEADEGRQELKGAGQMYAELKKRFPAYSVGMVHGRQNVAERREEMRAFLQGERHILVATTVIEVGVDVSNATVMVIEHAERFGLAALHQLRGRVGRGRFQSYCYLVYDPALTEEGKERLKVMKEQKDGFDLAEADLRIRGPGSIVGMEQSGYLKLEFASLYEDLDLIEALGRSEMY